MCWNGRSQNDTPTISEKSGDATLTTRSSRPCSARMRSKTASTWASSVWSQATATAVPPRASISATVRSRLASCPGTSSTERAVT